MSIVSNALKKTQELRNTKKQKENSIRYFFPEHVPQKKFGWFKNFFGKVRSKTVLRKTFLAALSAVIIMLTLKTVLPHIIPADKSSIYLNYIKNIKFIKTKKQPLPILNGIMFSQNQPYAIINGIVVSEGSTIKNFSILKIFPTKVKISSGDEEFELTLP